jgi:RNA polymerase sigma factor (sigma-70 family)
MQELDDNSLLSEYAARGSEEAFATLVTRHVNKVYSVALRHTRNSHQAEEITQAVFVLLARKSRRLSNRVILSGWLCQTARLTALTFTRGEIRRARREQEAHMQNSLNETESDVWPQIAPLLDAAIARLSEADYHAVVLRFFDGKSMRDVGATLGASEDAAKMRINRAVEKLRLFFTQHGVVVPATILMAAISANAVQAAPAGLTGTLAGASLAAAGTGTTFTLLKIMTATQLKLGLGALVVAGATTAIVMQHQTQLKLLDENESLRQQLAQQQNDNNDLSNRLADAGDAKKLSDDQFNDLLRLRGEVGRLRQRTNELGDEVGQLQDNQPTNASSAQDRFILRQSYVSQALTKLATAMKDYAQTNNGQYPTDFNQLNLATNRFDGNVSLNDFDMINSTGPNGEKFILELRNPIPTPDGRWLEIYGGTNANSYTYNVENPNAGPGGN